MKEYLRKKTNKRIKKFRQNKKNKTRKNHTGAGLKETFDSANQTAQNLYTVYLQARNKYNALMEQYNQIESEYLKMKQTLERIKNDPEVQEHLKTLSELNSQIQQHIQKTNAPPSPPNTQEVIQNAGFLNSPQINSNLQPNIQLTNKYYDSYSRAKNVYNNPQVKKHLEDLSKHSKDTFEYGKKLGINIATESPISASYSGYNAYKSAKKGYSSAKNLYKSANDAYQNNLTQSI